MTETDQTSQQDADPKGTEAARRDDRRGEVKPTDNPVPRSPEPDADAVREGEEKLDRVKAY